MKELRFWILTMIAVLTVNHHYAAENSSGQGSEQMGFYFGGFGGWGFVKPHVEQKGTAFPFESAGGALAVNASGKADTSHFGFGGLHIGYEWLDRCEKNWSLVPGVEFEGFYLESKIKADILNPTTRLTEHDFVNTFPTKTWIFIADVTLALDNKYLTPYLGGGVGSGILFIHNADSKQIEPAEPNINHFNADPKASNSTFAAQLKVGLRYQLFQYMRLFGEYRCLYLAPVHFIFGSTDYPTHVTTSPWSVEFEDLQYNLFSLGVDFTF